jgi:hypothetical protein
MGGRQCQAKVLERFWKACAYLEPKCMRLTKGLQTTGYALSTVDTLESEDLGRTVLLQQMLIQTDIDVAAYKLNQPFLGYSGSLRSSQK